MSENMLITNKQDGLFTIYFNRTDRLNALNGELMDEFLYACQKAEQDDSIRAVIVSGKGRAFCAGGDVRDGAKPRKGAPKPTDPRQAKIDLQEERTQAAYLLHTMAKPTIAVVRGAAMGAGMSIALACDYRIISETTVFSSAFVNNALSGDYGMAYFLANAIGIPKAMELIMLSKKLDAAAIDELGLATKLVADDELDATALAFAQRLASGPTVAYAGIKSNLIASATTGLKDYLKVESENQITCAYTQDIREAGKAFIEKRKPVFKGL